MPVEVGNAAPDFTLKDQNNQLVTLSSFRGEKNVLLVFYPLAFSGTCQGELCAVRDNIGDYETDDLQVLSISVDSAYSHKVWAEQQGYTFPLLSDFWPHGGVAQEYGAFNEVKGFAKRATFLIDREGVVRFAEVSDGARDLAAWNAAIKELDA